MAGADGDRRRGRERIVAFARDCRNQAHHAQSEPQVAKAVWQRTDTGQVGGFVAAGTKAGARHSLEAVHPIRSISTCFLKKIMKMLPNFNLRSRYEAIGGAWVT